MASSSSNFRARRLSVSDIDTSEFDKAKSGTTPIQGGRQRRLSLSPEMGQKGMDVTIPPDVCGTFSCHGVEPGQRQGESHGKINQDRGSTSFPLDIPYRSIKCTEALFSVYDGHGSKGDMVSDFVVRTVPEILTQQQELLDTKDTSGGENNGVAQALKKAFVKTDELLQANKKIDAELSGTTAVAVLIRQYADSDELHIWTAWAGDSRAVLWTASAGEKTCTKTDVKDLSHDHKPDTPKESARIKKAGGTISPPEEEWGGPARVWLDSEMTLPGLAMARSIGDHLVSKVGVIAEPEVTHEVLNMSDGKQRYLVIASDGVWEFIDSHQAMQLIAKSSAEGATRAVTKLIETSAAKWREEEGDYRDDITAICVSLHELVKSKEWHDAIQ
uniref:PPM-type phosphatase domain-containing protein n=1 Tax=Haptolina brevifila TaxID=156173 RepID=A0A7S2H776_9EUKA